MSYLNDQIVFHLSSSKTMKKLLFPIFATLFFLFLLYLFNIEDYGYHPLQNRIGTAFTKQDSPTVSSDQCVLKKYDIWEPNIQEYVNLKAGDEVCRSNFTIITFLESGQLKVKADNYYCEGRCVSRKHNTANNYGKWQNDTDFKYECEFVEARCAVGNNSEDANFTYGMIHSQIFKQETPNPKQNNSYNVFVMMIDSLGMSQAYRNLPKTMNFMEKSLEAVPFPHINKVGANSRPNAFALWFGIQLEPIDRTLFGLPTVPVDRTWEDTCDTWLDNETIIFDEFNSQGYKTMLADESASSAEIYPYCKGLQRSFLTHKFQPFKIAKELESPLLNGCYRDENCVFFHRDMLKYQQQFIDAYKGLPKFSWIWSLIGHDDESKSMKLDTDILEFLLNNRKVLDESFLVIIGDHGLRHGGVLSTKLGKRDSNNPAFIISLPKALRNTPLNDQMLKNAQNLQTHYDVRATFLDIAWYQPKSEFSDLEPLLIPNEKGQSLFRKQIGERSCRTLPIPFDYCICEMEMKKFDGDLSEFENAGKEIVATVNTMLSEKKLTEICHQWTFLNVSSMSVYLPIEKQVYSAIVYSNSPIGTAQFSAIFRLKSDGNYVAGNIDRVDSFGNRGNCVKGQRQMNKLCDCKEQKSR